MASETSTVEQLTRVIQNQATKIEELQNEVERLTGKSNALPEIFDRKQVLHFLDDPTNVYLAGFSYSDTPQGEDYWTNVNRIISGPIPEDALKILKDWIILSYRQALSE
jgi:hypothetical protein